MFAYRAGRIPRYYVNCLAISRAVPVEYGLTHAARLGAVRRVRPFLPNLPDYFY